MAILTHLIRLTNQLTIQPLPLDGIAITHHFSNGDFSPYNQIDQPTDQQTTSYKQNTHFFQIIRLFGTSMLNFHQIG